MLKGGEKMRKKRIAIFTLLLFLTTLIPVLSLQQVQAYSNTSYFSDLKIGLESMAASSLIGKTYGEYYLNGNIIPSGAILRFTVTNGKININGEVFESVKLAPEHYGSSLYLTGISRTNRYMGVLEFKVDNNRVYPVNTLPIEDYLKGVIGYEMSENYPIEALKAQAVAARTYALKHKGALITTKGFDFNDTITYQVYYGYNPAFKNVDKAVRDTVGQVATYNNYLIDALFSASHGGYTESAVNVWGNSVAYLMAKPDILNGQAIDNASWSLGTVSFTAGDVESELKKRDLLEDTDKFVKLNLDSITKYPSGRVSNIDIIYTDVNGNTKNRKITGDRCRTFLPLQSSMWNLAFDGTTYKFTGKAYGHGLGMSQVGAKQRALLGQTYRDILKFYYDSTQLANLYNAPTLSTYTQSTTQVYIGQPVELSAGAQNGTGNYLYKYVVLRDGAAILDTGYTESSTYTYNPMAPGSYQFVVYLKDTQSNNSFDDFKPLNVRTLEVPSITSVTPDGGNSIVNQVVTFNTQIKGGSGDFLYKYSVYQNGKLLEETPYESTKSYSFVPTNAGSYQITAYIKDKVDMERAIDPMSGSVNVFSAPKITESDISGSMYAGRALTISSVNTVGSLQGVLFKYEIYRNNILYASRNYNSDKKFSFTPNAAGSYIIKAYIKDVVSKDSYDSMKSSTISIQSLPLNITRAALSYGMNNSDVKALQNALIKLGYKLPSATGYYGSQTKTAVVAFQKSKGLKQTGTVDKATLSAINDSLIGKLASNAKPPVTNTTNPPVTSSPKPPAAAVQNSALTINTLPLSYGRTHKDVAVLQNALIKLGYKISSATGYYGSQTKAAVIAFQKSKGLKQTGIVDKTTLSVINSSLIKK